MILNPEDWFTFAEARNNTVHTYNEKNAQQVFKVALSFLPAVNAFYSEIEQHND